ncbi:MAG: hypothetical protein NZ914_06340, partial [Gemmatales bacterium]|nr:hypothetical protein [Gemmatales bacterium]
MSLYRGVGLVVESLESRCQPAGTVTVLQSGGIVRLLGDAANNDVALTATGSNTLTIAGLSGTSISGPTTVMGVNRVYLELGAGADSTSITAPSSFSGQIIARASPGDDSFNIGNGQYDGSIVVLEQHGNDSLVLTSGVFTEPVIIRTGSGNDNVSSSASTFWRRFELSTSRGSDNVNLSTTNFADRAVLHTDDDNDVLTLTNLVFSTHSRFDLGTGHDQAVLNNVTFPAGKPQSVIIGGLGV